MLATIDGTADQKLSHFAVRLALSGHVGVPRENELDFLTEADAVFNPPQKKAKPQKTPKASVVVPKPRTKAKKQLAA